MEKLRIGIIGTGGISNSHVKAYQQMEDVEIVAGADIVPGKAREALDRWNLPQAKAFENTQEMLDTMELDAVSVCTYNTAHAECAIQALRAGCHVLLEKPMTVTLEDAQAVRRVEKETGKILTIGFQPRYDGRMRKIKEIVQSGQLGKVYYIQTGGGRRRQQEWMAAAWMKPAAGRGGLGIFPPAHRVDQVRVGPSTCPKPLIVQVGLELEGSA